MTGVGEVRAWCPVLMELNVLPDIWLGSKTRLGYLNKKKHDKSKGKAQNYNKNAISPERFRLVILPAWFTC